MWCETVPCDSPTGSVRSQMHASLPSSVAIRDSSRTRVGSPSALKIRAMRSASSAGSASTAGGVQQLVVSMVTGRLMLSVSHVLTFFDRCAKVVVLMFFALRRSDRSEERRGGEDG